MTEPTGADMIRISGAAGRKWAPARCSDLTYSELAEAAVVLSQLCTKYEREIDLHKGHGRLVNYFLSEA